MEAIRRAVILGACVWLCVGVICRNHVCSTVDQCVVDSLVGDARLWCEYHGVAHMPFMLGVYACHLLLYPLAPLIYPRHYREVLLRPARDIYRALDRDRDATMRASFKLFWHDLLSRNGVNVPRLVAIRRTRDGAVERVDTSYDDLVYKPLRGSCGWGVHRTSLAAFERSHRAGLVQQRVGETFLGRRIRIVTALPDGRVRRAWSAIDGRRFRTGYVEGWDDVIGVMPTTEARRSLTDVAERLGEVHVNKLEWLDAVAWDLIIHDDTTAIVLEGNVGGVPCWKCRKQ